MSRPAVLFGVLMACAGLARAGSPSDFLPYDPEKALSEVEREQRVKAVEPGLSPDQVRRLIGAPRHTGRQILYHHCLEQWLYDSTFAVRLEFDCPRGQEPRLLSVQALGPGGR